MYNSYSNMPFVERERIKFKRRTFTSDERAFLQTMFAINPKPSIQQKRNLATQLGVELFSIHNWFYRQNRKHKTGMDSTL